MSCVLIAQDTRIRKWSGMPEKTARIGVVAPACRIDPAVAQEVRAMAAKAYGSRVDVVFHPQCHLNQGHFAGTDAQRAEAFVEVANDPEFDAVWFGRGGYGSVRIVDAVVPALTAVARKKTYLGYSDLGILLGALYARGFAELAHGPMPADIMRKDGGMSVLRALSYLVERSPSSIEGTVASGGMSAAFNMTILSNLIGTPHLPDLSGHVLMLEEVSEHMYRIDRTMAHIMSSPVIRKVAGIRLGRCSQVPVNDPDFGMSEVDVVQHWCAKAGIAYLGRADIGHDIDNKVVPFGGLVSS